MSAEYTHAFYASRHKDTRHAASTVLSLVLERIPPVRSAVDIGCGVGTWLSVLRDKGVTDIQGLDGSWVNPDLLAIPKNSFCPTALDQPINVQRRYDLAISLEVAEHLPEGRAGDFVGTLTRFSDFVLFSAAIPMQGGNGHINEQWQHYWVDLFATCGYAVHDFIRPCIWNDGGIPFWYRQNILLFSRAGKEVRSESSLALDLVHPDMLALALRRAPRSPLRALAGRMKRLLMSRSTGS